MQRARHPFLGSRSEVACCAISHRRAEGFLTLPAGRPLKPLYIMLFLQLVESVVDAR